jgi:hypothetical protein
MLKHGMLIYDALYTWRRERNWVRTFSK